MTLDEIRELIRVVTDTGIAELEVQRGENRVRIRRALPLPQEYAAAAYAFPPPEGASANTSGPPSPNIAAPEADANLVFVKSPIVGTFYEGSSPASPPFVNIGDAVQPGKVLCIIESMKLMNEIEAEIAGVVASKLVANGQPVEYGEALFAIRPL
ncbi:MAG: acetyl-CoA carboxylase biotin carboxyl carrier protein [Bryobacteraceae bacterium]